MTVNQVGAMPDLINCDACGQVVFASTVMCWRCGQPTRRPRSFDGRSAVSLMQIVGATVVVAAAVAGAAFGMVSRDGRAAPQVGAAPPARVAEHATHTPDLATRDGTHTVGPNESLFSVAFLYGVTPAELRYWNREAYPTLDSTPALQPGWVLRVAGPPLPTEAPEASPAQAAATVAPAPAGGGDGLVSLPILTVDVWSADVRYFAIGGSTPSELLASIEANIPPDPNGGSTDALAYVGPVEWDFRPAYRPAGRTGCTIAGTTTSVTYQATIPQWTSPSDVPPQLLEWWSVVLEYIRWHEEQHVRIFEAYVAELPGRLAGQPCDELQAIVNQWTAELIAAHDAFDTAERTWRPPPYHGPSGSTDVVRTRATGFMVGARPA